MSRLRNYQKKQLIKNLVFLFIFLVIIFYFAFTLGIKLLIDASIFIANLGSRSKDNGPTVKNTNFLGNIDIENIPSATNSAKMIVSGSALNFDTIDFYLNDVKVKSIDLNSSANFSEEIGDLEPGNNEFFAVAKSKKSNERKKTNEFIVVYKATKPKLEITSPANQSKSYKQNITVSGRTDKETFITVNGAPVVVDAQGNFQTSVKLSEGENKIEIVARDIADNTETQVVTVTYQKEE